MSKHKMPRELAELKGADKKNPQRYRNLVPKSAYDIGEPPAMMTDKQKAIWYEICDSAIPGTLTSAERIPLELAACLLDEFRQYPLECATSRIAMLVGILSRFGMTPVDRQKLNIPGQKQIEANEFEAF